MALSTQIVRSSSSSLYSSTSQSSYDVFISFCGTDTRTGFVDHLYAAFKQRGLIVFKDDKKLERGKLIREGLLEAIEQSQYAVVVISENFACSKWCLIELDKIVECETKTGLKIFPIFYRIDPSEVRKQQQIFAQAFAKNKQDPDVDEEQRTAWSAALEKVGNIAGWHVEPNISAEATVVKEITRRIFCGLQLDPSGIFNDLVGIESRVKELCFDMDNVWSMGIYGMAGIGKTTLAKVIFETVRSEFDASCFICCGDENRIWKLQQQILREILGERNLKIQDPIHGIKLLKTRIRNKKVFIVLDDAKRDHLEQLAGSVDWFGEGSRIIVIGKDRQLLKPYMNKTYEVEPLGYKDALELFCQKAFKTFRPEPSYLDLVGNIMRQVNGHPLAIAVIGSSLFGKGKEEWIGVRDVLEVDSEGEILTKLKISYGMLGDSLKKCFLDIACFGGWFVDILKNFDSSTNSHIGALEDKSLINTSRFTRVVMHDLLRKLGQRQVIKMSPLEPGNRSRLWVNHDIIQVLKNDSGSVAIEGIVVSTTERSYSLAEQRVEVNYECFSRMSRLTVLIIPGLFLYEQVKWIGDPSKLLLNNKLRVIIWHHFPLKSLSSFQANNLVELCLPFSKMEVLWIGKKSFGQLRNIDLSWSEYLTETPDLSGVPNLEKLCLSFCRHLRKIHPSIRNLGKLVQLKLHKCRQLGDNMTSSLHLVSHNSGIETNTPYSLKEIGSDPPNTCNLSWLSALTSLTNLDLSYCNLSDRDIPNDISCFSFLENLNLSQNGFTRIPEGIPQLSNLKHLYMHGCRYLQSLSTSLDTAIPNHLGYLSSGASLHLSRNKLMTLLDNLFLLSKLESLTLGYSSQLRALPKFPLSLRNLAVEDCLLSEMNYYQIDGRKLPLYNSIWFSVATNTSYDGTPYKILQLNPRHLITTDRNDLWDIWVYHFAYGDMFAWGPTLGFETPGWFNHICIMFFHNIQCCVDVDLEYRIKGLALFVAYEVYEQENSNCSKSRGTSSTFPEFVCRFRASDICEELPLVIRVPEVRLFGLNGFWAYIPAELFEKNGMELYNYRYLETSFETRNLNVEVKECGIRLVYEHNVSEFFDVLNSITPPGLELKNLKDFDFDLEIDVFK